MMKIFALLLLSIAARSSAADGLDGRIRRSLRSLQDADEAAVFGEDEATFADAFDDLSMSMLTLDDEGPLDEIINGREITEEEFEEKYSYLVSMGRESRPSGCGGSAISHRAILTAAHCFMDYTTGKLNATRFDFIEVNRYNKQTDLDNGVGGEPVERRYFDRVFQDPGTPVGSAQIHIHPFYDGRVRLAQTQQQFTELTDSDFALVILKEPLPDYIKPVKLNTDNSVPAPGTNVDVMGWGITEDLVTSDTPKIVTTKAISDEECVERLSEYNATYLPENQLCTFNDENKGSCGGDSGGPLVYNNGIENVQVGVVSWGPCNGGKALPLKYPSGLARVSRGYDWIVSTTCYNTNGEASFCQSAKSGKSIKSAAS